MRDEFLSIASHELRTPITSLFLELQLLDRELKKSQASEGVSRLSMGLKRSLRQTSRLTQLLDELLDLTRIQVGKFEIHPVSADLVTSVKDTVAKFQLESSQRGSPISTDWPAHLTAFFDPLKIEQVLTNLISNAIKYGGATPIQVRVSSQGKEVQVRVSDQGPGISEDMQSRLFKRFERAESDPQIQGLGLGLYISNQIMEAHGGSITVESSPSTGTAFTVHLSLKAS